MEIEKLLLQPESRTLEFKRDTSSWDPILKTIIAFANTAGGILIIGRSSSGEIVGLKDIFKAEEALANSIADNIRPLLLPEIEVVTLEGKDLLVVKISHWRAPFYLKKEGIPNGVYIRLGSTSRPAGPELLSELQRSVLFPSFDQQPLSDLEKQALDVEKVQKAFGRKKIDEEQLRTLGILVPVGRRFVPSIGGLILFGNKEIRQQYLPHVKISCARFLSDTKANILDQMDLDGSLLDAIQEVPKFIRRNTRLAGVIQEIYRKDVPEYPPIAIREALINAFAHADYSLSGSSIQIAIFDNRLEIENPGMFPFGFTIEDLKAGGSKVRNWVIARVFHELKLMEEWGGGYRRIIENCRQEGYPEPKWEELGTSIRVTFYSHEATVASSEKEVESEREAMILSFFKEKQTLPFREIFRRMTPPVSERLLRYELAQMKKKGLLKQVGKGRSIVWKKG